MLLENAFSEKEVHDVKPRKPLSDIGNTPVSTAIPTVAYNHCI
jgi:hypothetical protein